MSTSGPPRPDLDLMRSASAPVLVKNKPFKAAHPNVILFLILSYICAVVFVTVFLVLGKKISIVYVMLLPMGLAVSMYAWLGILMWPLRFRYDTISSASAAQSENYMRIILVAISCLLATAMTAILVDEYESRPHANGNRRADEFLICEIVFCLLLPITGLFPTVEIPEKVAKTDQWQSVNVGTNETPVYVNGLFSFLLHFIGVIPFMFSLPVINVLYAHSRPETWVFFLAYGTVANLMFFLTCQGLIRYRKMGFLTSLDLDILFFCSIVSESLLLVAVSFSTVIFSMKRNNHVMWEGKLDLSVRECCLPMWESSELY